MEPCRVLPPGSSLSGSRSHLKASREEAVNEIGKAWLHIAAILSASEAVLETAADKDFSNMVSSLSGSLASRTLNEVVALAALAAARAYYDKQIKHWLRDINDCAVAHFVDSLKSAITARRAVVALNEEVGELVSKPKAQVEKRRGFEQKMGWLKSALKEIEHHRSMTGADAGRTEDEDE